VRSPTIRTICSVLCALAIATAARAQETINTASVSGRVLDPQGAVVPGAQVIARHLETNVAAETVTDQTGRFRFPYLKVGRYAVTVRLQGFTDVTRTLTLTVGAAFELPISLSVASLDTSVTVTAEPTVLEAARTQIAATVSQAEISSLPLNGRNFLDLALLVPGVSPTNVASTQLFPETSAVPGAGLSIGSQRNFSNNFIVDGLSANDDAAGLSGMPYAVDAIDQFQVVTSGGHAELGRALGGYVSVVTKSGSNTTRGDLYDFVRDDRFNAANALSRTTLPMHQDQYGGSLGGPLVRDRMFYFANVEQRKLDQVGLVTIPAATANTINAKLAAVGYPGSPIATGMYPNPVDTTNVLVKTDHQIGGGDQLNVRFSQYTASSTNARGAGGVNAPSASASLDNVDRTLAAGNTLSLSPRMVNETRAQVTFSDLQAPPTDPIGPAVSISGVASFGTLSGSPTRRVNTLYQLVDNLSYQAGSHALRGGADVLYNDDTITYPRSIRGAYTFSTLQNFLAGAYNTAGFTQTFGATEVSQTNPNLGLYAQDEWKVNPDVTVNAGIRYDLQFLQTIGTDANNVSPRAGIAWTPTPSRRTVVRASAGLFYDRVPLRALANAVLSAGNTTDLANLRQIGISLSPTQASAPVFPNILGAPIPLVTLPNLATMDQNIQNAHSRQAGVEVEQALGARSTVSIGYQYTRGVDLLISVNQNVPTCVAAGTNNGCRPIPSYANNSQYSSLASSSYHGVHMSFVQRPTSWGSIRVSYALSKAMDNVGEFFFSSPIDPTDLSRDWGRSDDDQRHRLVVNAAVNTSMDPARTMWEYLTHGFQVSGVMQYYSALPLNITSGVTSIQGTAGRPLVEGPTTTALDVRTAAFIPRNSGTGPDFFSVGARVSRAFRIGDRLRIDALVEGFNLTNRKNVITMIGNFGPGAYPSNPSPTFSQITAVGDPRSVQFGFRARF
jgi:hypothetical protein